MQRLLPRTPRGAVLGTALAIGLLGPGATSALAGYIVLDTFDGPQGALGQDRTLDQMVHENPFGFATPLETFVNEAGGFYAFISDPAVLGTGYITYDNFAGGSADLSSATGFKLDFATVDQDAPMSIDLVTFDDMGGVAGTASVDLTMMAGVNMTVSAAIGDFTVTGDFDLANIGEVLLTFNPEDGGTPSLDFTLTEFRATPTPSALALLAIGGLVARGSRRRI